jgi:Ni/Co efflux regulator RcnB
MNKIISAITLSLSAMVATSAMAGSSYDHRVDHQNYSTSHANMSNKHYADQHNDKYDDHRYKNNSSRYQEQYKRNIKPARDWRAGQILPRQFNPNTYAVSYKDARRLFKPNNHQQWLKINGDYVLINERNHKIVKIIA